MERNENLIIVYFCIHGDFKVEELAKYFDMPIEVSWDKNDIREADNKPYGFSMIKFKEIEGYDPIVSNMMEKCIEPFLDKIDLLNKLREQYNLEYYLSVVPFLVVDNMNPALAPSLKVMEFCVKTKTQIDCDLYLYKE